MLEERSLKKGATILCVEMSYFDILRGRYRLRFEKWWQESQNESSLGNRDGEANIEIHVIRVSTWSIVIEDFMNVEQRQRLT